MSDHRRHGSSGADAAVGSGVAGVPGRSLDGVEWTPGHRTAPGAGARHQLTAVRALSGIATGRFSEPSVSVEFALEPLFPERTAFETELLGFAFTQFAMPVVAGAFGDFDFHPTPNLRSPRAVLPLLARNGDRSVLFAPLFSIHEQILTVRNGRIAWGWHGDLDEVPPGFRTELGVYVGSSPTEVMARWAADVLGTPRVRRPDPATRDVTSRLSYWTDNGAAYWYRTEPECTIGESVAAAVERLRDSGVPVHAIELDSWFYPHEIPRPITEIGYPEDVPPSGAMRWEPRPDAFPSTAERDAPDADALERFTARLGHPPLVLHARHVSPRSPDVGTDGAGGSSPWWVDDRAAQPVDPGYFRTWLEAARGWGATCVEIDWMLMTWFGVREMRRVPQRAVDWQVALDEAAAELDLDLMWCMATPADLIVAAGLERVTAVRTCDDYRFTDDPAHLWTWFLTVNRLVGPLGLPAFKDCFFSSPDLDPGHEPIDGDPHAELEALLSALSAGPVGIGDRIDRTDRDIVLRTCDEAGCLLRPDRPVGMIDDCLFGAPARGERLAWGATSTTVDDRTWTYVVAVNTAADRRRVADELALAELGISGAHYVYDWRRGDGAITERIVADLGPRDWSYHVCCPVVDGRWTVGDTTKYVTVPRPSTPP